MNGWTTEQESGRASETPFQTADPAIQLFVYLDSRADGFTLRLSGNSPTESFPFSHEDGTRLLGAIHSAGNSAHLLEECGHVLLTDPSFDVGVDGKPLRPTFHFTLKGERSLDMTFSLDMTAVASLFSFVHELLEEQTIRGVMES